MFIIRFTDKEMAKDYAEKLAKAGFFSTPSPEYVSEKHFYLNGSEVTVSAKWF